MNNNIKLTAEAVRVIEALRHSAGTHEVYRSTLTRVFNQVLHTAEDLGMDELEALEILRAIDMLRRDLTALATSPSRTGDDIYDEDDESDDDEMVLLEGDGVDLMLDDINRGFHNLHRATVLINNAVQYSSNAGKKLNEVRKALVEIHDNLTRQGGMLNEIMNLDYDTLHDIEDVESTD